jgi:uncharacterized membrane protein YqiK
MTVILLGAGVLVAVTLLAVLLVSLLFRKVEQGKALIVSKLRKVDVTFTGQVVLPVLHKAEVMDISVKAIEITRTGKDGLICQDNIRADIRSTFFVKVNKTVDDVIKVAQAVGTDAVRGHRLRAGQRLRLAPTAALLRHIEVDHPPSFPDLAESRRLGVAA